MQHEPGDEYLRRLATFIRTNERSLAEGGLQTQRRPPPQKPGQRTDTVSLFNPLGWFGHDAGGPSSPKPVTLTMDTHRLFYVLMRLEAVGFDVGTLDVRIESPSRPMCYINLPGVVDKSETLSLASIRTSLSTVSGLSLGGSWWSKPEPPSVESELKYIFSSFTKVPALSLHAPGRKGITELAGEPPNQNALPLESFKNVQSLECVDIDPRTLLGWDKLAESLRSLKIRKSGLEDVSDIFIGAVVDDQARREGSTSRQRRRRIPRGTPKEEESSFFSTRLPETVVEDTDGEEGAARGDRDVSEGQDSTNLPSPSPTLRLSSLKWAFLKHLSLSDNSLTFLPSEPLQYLTSITHLDLSSNLLVSVPPNLSGLYNLVSLNLADNMIDSVLGIYTHLGQVLYLNLSHNRLESICGLERLMALERIDLRSNFIEESSEVGRLSVLPNILDVRVEGNPFVEVEDNYRVACFDYFWKEGKTIKLDGTEPGLYERRNLCQQPPAQMSSARPPSVEYSPLAIAVNHSRIASLNASTNAVPIDGYPTPPSSNASPYLGPAGSTAAGAKSRKKKVKRIVDLDRDSEHSDVRGPAIHSRDRSDASSTRKRTTKASTKIREPSPQPLPQRKWGQIGTLTAEPEEEILSKIRVGVDVEPSSICRTESSSTIKPGASNATVTPTASQLPPPRPKLRARHGRYQTEVVSSMSSADFGDDNYLYKPTSVDDEVVGVSSKGLGSVRRTQRLGTMASRSGARNSRVSASVYEPPTAHGEASGIEETRDSAEAYRKKLEALKKDMGDNWLKVYAQSQTRRPLSP